MNTRPRLLYLGHALPPGVSALFPQYSPAGHRLETSLVNSVRADFDVRSVGCTPLDIPETGFDATRSPGLPNALNLLDRAPHLLNWIRSLAKLNRTYATWVAEGWRPEVVVAYNLSPIYNAFVRRLARQPDRPRLVLYLADSALLGVRLPPLKRFRYSLKPFKWLDDEMAVLFDACASASADTEGTFKSRGIPWLWLPNGIDSERMRRSVPGPKDGAIVFGYFGHANAHAGLPQLLRVFTASNRRSELRVCCFGKNRPHLEQQFGGHPHVSFHGPFDDPEECVTFGSGCDVLVNPRPIIAGSENNFPSKVFEYSLTGRPILSSNLSGVKEVLGPDAFYFEARDFDTSLAHSLDALSLLNRDELRRRGTAIQQAILAGFSWQQQGSRLAAFLKQILEEH